jgi:hypothetical protein
MTGRKPGTSRFDHVWRVTSLGGAYQHLHRWLQLLRLPQGLTVQMAQHPRALPAAAAQGPDQPDSILLSTGRRSPLRSPAARAPTGLPTSHRVPAAGLDPPRRVPCQPGADATCHAIHHRFKHGRGDQDRRKGSDVALATYLVYDACRGDCQASVVITNDSDLREPLRIVNDELHLTTGINHPHPPHKRSRALTATFFKQLRPSLLSQCQLPPSGSLSRPVSASLTARPTSADPLRRRKRCFAIVFTERGSDGVALWRR